MLKQNDKAMKNTKEREPKANYFLRRMVEAYDNGLKQKGDYYLSRLQKMGIKPIATLTPSA